MKAEHKYRVRSRLPDRLLDEADVRRLMEAARMFEEGLLDAH